MTLPYDQQAPKKATNLSINSSLLTKAKMLELNLSATLERALSDELRKAERAQWLEQNKKAIAAANALADENGRFVDAYRTL